jgi:serine protease Do
MAVDIETTPALAAVLLPGAASDAIAEMVERVKPSVVQVMNGRRGAGAGVIWRSNGGIVTNYHVIAGGGPTARVLLTDGRELEARVVNSNPALDLALLQADAEDLPAAPVADSSQLRVGELVFAVGHPWGQPHVVTMGIVSAHGEVPMPRSERKAQYVRSDVNVAPGNSGGPMLNAQGAVVGITAMIFGGDMAVAIPSHVATEWVAGLPSRRVYLGVGVQPVELPPSLFEKEHAEAEGLMVVAVDRDGPAHRAGLLVGDVLLSMQGKPVIDGDSLLGALAKGAEGEPLRLKFWRGGAVRELDLDLSGSETKA